MALIDVVVEGSSEMAAQNSNPTNSKGGLVQSGATQMDDTNYAFDFGNNSSTDHNRSSEAGAGLLSASVSSFSSTSSRGSSSTSANNTKNMLFSQKSPRILTLYLYIVFGVFLSFMVVTSINFTIYMQKKNTVDLKI